MRDKPAFTDAPLDRADWLREDADALAALRAAPGARIAAFWRLKPLVRIKADGAAEPAWAESAALLAPFDPDVSRPEIFLGLEGEGGGVFADALDPNADPAEAAPEGAVRFMELREAAALLSPEDGSILAAARSLLAWHETHGFCSRCGGPSTPSHAGWRRICERCLEEHYPRVNPVVIMVIARGDKILLGRGPTWPENFYSCLAGFMEPGETPEQAARREALEESGIVLGEVGYLMAQPWPFPGSLMLGMHAEALGDEISLEGSELADVRWFSRVEVADVMASRSAIARTPADVAVAHHLIRWWLDRG